MRRLTWLIALLVVSAGYAAGETPTVAVAPLQMRGLMPVVQVKLNGQGPFAFMIDTGAGMQADIDIGVAERLKLQATGKVLSGDPSGENDQVVTTAKLDSITFGGDGGKDGGIEFRSVTAVVRRHKITNDYPDVDGILGFALFTDYLLTLDYPAMQVRLARGALPPANGADVVGFELENRIPVIELAIGKIRVRAHVDTGNFVAGFILPEEIVDQLQILAPPIMVGSARSISNRIVLRQVQLRDTIRVGRFEFTEPTVQFPALSDTNLGFKILRGFVLTFDQKNRRLKLEN